MPVSPSLRVALEAAVHCGTPGDVEFYVDLCAGARSVLELGCGAGRVGGVIVQSGPEVTGIDLDEAALSLAADRGIDVVRADMRDFRLDRRFERVIVPFSGLYCLLSEEDVSRCLASAREHLAPGGCILFDCYGADVFHAGSAGPDAGDGQSDEESVVASVVVAGRRWRVHERSAWWRGSQRIDAWYRYEPADGEGAFETCIRQRYLLRDQLTELLRRAGLALLGVDGGFDAEPWRPDAGVMAVAAARLPGASDGARVAR